MSVTARRSPSGEVEQVGLASLGVGFAAGVPVYDGHEVFPNGFGVDMPIGLGKLPLQVPVEAEAGGFVGFKALEFFSNVKLESWRKPQAKVEGNVLMRKIPTIPTCFCLYSNGVSHFNPFFSRQNKAV